MAEQLLQINGLKVSAEDKEILHGIDLTVNRGETHVLMGPNGAGKSTLGYALMGNPNYMATQGSIRFDGKDITEEAADKRAKEGIFLSFQNPLEVPGISLGSFIRSALEQRRGENLRLWDFRREMKKAMDVLQMEESYGDRDLNVGFSGGEKRRPKSCSCSCCVRHWRFWMKRIPDWMWMRCVPFPAALRNIRKMKGVLFLLSLTAPKSWKP